MCTLAGRLWIFSRLTLISEKIESEEKSDEREIVPFIAFFGLKSNCTASVAMWSALADLPALPATDNLFGRFGDSNHTVSNACACVASWLPKIVRFGMNDN